MQHVSMARFGRCIRWPALLAIGVFGSAGAVALAQDAGSPAPSTRAATSATASRPTVAAPSPSAPTPEEGVRWHKLKPAQREALRPLQQEWGSIDAPRKQKWLGVADRLPSMPADERARVQARMADWARLTPIERGQARLRFQEAKQIPASDRVDRWEAYKALPPDQKNELAARAAAARATALAATGAAEFSARRGTSAVRSEGAQVKSNIVPNPTFAAPRRPIAPTVVQAGPGATTTLVTRQPSPPPHQQTGQPKIAATAEFVDKSTLLPQRGAQGAAVRAVPAGAPAPVAPAAKP